MTDEEDLANQNFKPEQVRRYAAARKAGRLLRESGISGGTVYNLVLMLTLEQSLALKALLPAIVKRKSEDDLS